MLPQFTRRSLIRALTFVVLGMLLVLGAERGRAASPEEQQYLAAIVASDAALTAAQAEIDAAAKTAKEIEMPADQAVDSEMLRRLESLVTLVKRDHLPKLSAQVEALGKAKTTLAERHTAAAAIPAGEQSEPLKAGLARYTKLNTDLTEKNTKVGTGRDDYQKALDSIYERLKGVASKLLLKLNELPKPGADAAELRTNLPKLLPQVTLTLNVRRAVDDLKKALAEAKSADHDTKYKAVADALPAPDKALSAALDTITPAVDKLTADTKGKQAAAEAILQDVLQNPEPVKNRVKAATLSKEAAELAASNSGIIAAATTLAGRLEGLDAPSYVSTGARNKITKSAGELGDAGRGVSATVALVQESLLGDLAEFVAEQVPLYYFDDAARLIRVLNPKANGVNEIGGVPGLREKAQEERRKLDEATTTLLSARQTVNDTRTEVARLQQELSQQLTLANAANAAARAIAAKTGTALGKAKGTQTTAQLNYDAAKRRADAVNADPNATPAQKQTANDALEQALQSRDRANADATAADTANTGAQGNVTSAQQKVTDLQDESKGLGAKLKSAEEAAAAASTDVRKQGNSAYLAALTESAAFALARDNTPFLFSAPTAISTDPVDRVFLFAFNDSKSLFIRGRPTDVEKVKEMVAQFDRPQGQALMTLWSLEISSDGSTSGARKANRALEIIEEELALSRRNTDAALFFLRDCTTRQAEVANKVGDFEEAVTEFYDTRVIESLMGHTPGAEMLGPELSLQEVIPNPAGTTTLAETLVILGLAKQSYRIPALEQFGQQLQARLADATPGKPTSDLPVAPSFAFDPKEGWFPSLRRYMGADLDAQFALKQNPKPLMTSFQQEIVFAIRRNVTNRLLQRVDRLKAESTRILQKQQELKSELDALPQGDPRAAGLKNQLSILEELLKDNTTQLMPNLAWLSKQYRIPLNSALAANPASIRNLVPRNTDNARTAAANEKLKQMIRAVDEDVQYHFIQPMLKRLTSRLLDTHVGLGVLQRTTILSSNRLIARVDPKGSANLALGETQDVLTATMQLVQLAAAAQTGGLTSLFGGLDQLPKEAPPAIYGIATGNVFEVRPVTDPSGQALRFRFDHVASTQVQEPNRTTDPQLPRIERHTVNTEVQLSNLEIREISRFQSNLRLGLPRRLKGGIPVLNNIPVIRELPLIGWFTKRTGKAAAVQQSLILGQTTIYPTIGDVVDLLTLPATSTQ